MNDARATAIGAILGRHPGIRVDGIRRIAGGDVNDAYRVETPGGTLFVKTRDGAAPGAFAQEAAGLRWLAEARGAPPVAQVVLVHDAPSADGAATAPPPEPRFLVLRWIEPGAASAAEEERFGRGLANLHAAACPAFGWAPATDVHAAHEVSRGLRIGDVALPAQPVGTFAEFWVEQRVLALTAQARATGAFDAADAALMGQLADRIPELVGPAEPPARIHGDLWAGNALADASGRIHLIDPLAHGSHREVDLATLRVFGGPGHRCFDAYAEAYPLADGHEERVPLMQLAVLLLHVVMFGGGYVERVRGIARRYV